MEKESRALLQQRIDMVQQLAAYSKLDLNGSGKSLGIHCLLDAFMALYEECSQNCFSHNKNIVRFLDKYSTAFKNTKQLLIGSDDFEVKATVGHGHFGKVHVVHEKTTDVVYAMKVLCKSDLLAQSDISFFEEERDIMAYSISPWLTKLHFAFQDAISLYFVMDFHPGGDLLSLMSRHDDLLEESMARFYLSEMAMAIHDLHLMGFLHRDIKPENVLIQLNGHIKLADFGSAARVGTDNQVSAKMPVGTPDYVAPELLDSVNSGRLVQQYSTEVDWWSLGVCAFELLVGCTPFTDKDGSMLSTYSNIMNFKKMLQFPPNRDISQEAQDFITQLLTDSKNRLAWPSIVQHPFFCSIDWDNILTVEPPYLPTVSSLDDTSNFDDVERSRPLPNVDCFRSTACGFSGKQLPFVGFTFYHCSHRASSPPRKNLNNSLATSEMDSSLGLNTARYISHVDSTTSVISEPSDVRLSKSIVVEPGKMEQSPSYYAELEVKLEAVLKEKAVLERELSEAVGCNQTMMSQLGQVTEALGMGDQRSVEAWIDLKSTMSEITSLEGQILSYQLDELRDIIIQLESEQECLTVKLFQKEKELQSLKASLASAQQQLKDKQLKLDEERLKSCDGHKQDLSLFESQDEFWQKQVCDKQLIIDDLNKKIQDLEDVVAVYEDEEEQSQDAKLHRLQCKLKASLCPSAPDTAIIGLAGATAVVTHEDLPENKKRVAVHVTFRPENRCSVNKGHGNTKKLEALEELVSDYSSELESRKEEGESLQKKFNKLESDISSQRHQDGISQKIKHSLMSKVHLYQREVHLQRNLINVLQKKMRNYLDGQVCEDETKMMLKDVQCQNLNLETDLLGVRQEAEHCQQCLVNKTKKIEEISLAMDTLKSQYSEHKSISRREMASCEIKVSGLESEVVLKREAHRLLEQHNAGLLEQVESLQVLVDDGRVSISKLSKHNDSFQLQLQDFAKHNARLLVQVESLQNDDESRQADVKMADLQAQTDDLQRANFDLSDQLLVSRREVLEQEKRNVKSSRDVERIKLRMVDFEKLESNNHHLELKLDELGCVVRENRDMRLRLSCLDSLHVEKAELQAKVECLHLEVNSLQVDMHVLRTEKDQLSCRCEHLGLKNNAQSSKESISATSSSHLMLALLRSEKAELSSELTDLGIKDLSVKCLSEELHLKNQVVSDLSATILSMEEQLRVQESLNEELKLRQAEMDDLKDKLNLLGEQCKQKVVLTEQLDARHLDVSRLTDQVKLLEEELQTKNCMEGNFHLSQRQNSEFNHRLDGAMNVASCRQITQHEISTSEGKDVDMRVECSVAGSFGSEHTACDSTPLSGTFMNVEKQCLTGDVMTSSSAGAIRDIKRFIMSAEQQGLRSQLCGKDESIQSVLADRSSLNEGPPDLNQVREQPSVKCSSSSESERHLMEPLGMETTHLQRQLQQTERDCDGLQQRAPSHLTMSIIGRNSLNAVQEEGGFRIRQELEDKVRRLENVVRLLEQRSDLTTAIREGDSVVNLQRELLELRRQILQAASKPSDPMVPCSIHDDLQQSHRKVSVQFSGLISDLEKLEGENNMLKYEFGTIVKMNNGLEERVVDFEVENNCLRIRLSELEENKREGHTTKHSISCSDARTVWRNGRNNLIGELMAEKHALEARVKGLEEQLKASQRIKQVMEEHSNFLSHADVVEEKSELECRVESLNTELSLARDLQHSQEAALAEAMLKMELLEAQVKELMIDCSVLRKEVSDLRTDSQHQQVEVKEEEMKHVYNEVHQRNCYLETKVAELEKMLECANTRPASACESSQQQQPVGRDTLIATLRKELHQSNLAVSEARSLLSANKRQNAELYTRLDRLQRALDGGVVKRAKDIQMVSSAEQELRVVRSQYDTLQRQYQSLEQRHAGSHHDKAANVVEKRVLKDQLQSKQGLLDLQIERNKQLSDICVELEEQIKDLEDLARDAEDTDGRMYSFQHKEMLLEKDSQSEKKVVEMKTVAMLTRNAACDPVRKLSSLSEAVESQKEADLVEIKGRLQLETSKRQQMEEELLKHLQKEQEYNEVVQVQDQNLRAESEFIEQMKQESSHQLTEIQDLKSANLVLSKHLDQAMDKFELIFGQKVSLETFTEALQGLHFLEKYRFESTIGQQMKLIDYLQQLYVENAAKKKKGSKHRVAPKDCTDPHLVQAGQPVNWVNLKMALEHELKKNACLQEQLDEYRKCNSEETIESTNMRHPLMERSDTSPPITVPEEQNLAASMLVHSPSAKIPIVEHSSGRRGYYAASAQPTTQRMHHNIPHRFVSGLNTRATKCGLCLGSVHFVKQASKCQECGMLVHPKCATSVPATCGLPTEYVCHFTKMMAGIVEAEMSSSCTPLNIKLSGWLKVPRVGKPGWENRWVDLDGSHLYLYLDDSRSNLVDTFDLSPLDADVSVQSAVTAVELSNTTSLDLYYVLRVDQDPLTTCWPGRYLYLMTTNFHDKQRWVASLEAAVRSHQRQGTLRKNDPTMTTVLSLRSSERKEFNCALTLSPQLVLLGAEDGFFALNPLSTSGQQHLVQLSGFSGVHHLVLAKGVNLILVLLGTERRIVTVDSQLVKCRMSQTIGGETALINFSPIEGTHSCTVFGAALWRDASYLCIGFPDRITLMKYNPSLAMYCCRKEMPTNQPCSCICISEGVAIIGSDRFYRISLDHPNLLSSVFSTTVTFLYMWLATFRYYVAIFMPLYFVDRQDTSLALAAFQAANHSSFPVAVVCVSPEGLPIEFLLCFHEFGVFVDHRGQRSRPMDVKWSGLPLSFLYNDPFLYITYFNSVQATLVPTNKDQIKGCQTAVDLPAPRTLGATCEEGAVFVSTSSNSITDVILLRACDQHCFQHAASDDDKDNVVRHVKFNDSPDQVYGRQQEVTVTTMVSVTSMDSDSVQ